MGSIAGDESPRWDRAESAAAGGERILVSVRARPLSAKEIERNDPSDWECINTTTIIFKSSVPQQSMFPTAYTYDRVFGSESTTRQVYEEGAKDVALSVVSGIHSSIFAYGQTSSGKTYTMTGITEYSVSDIYDYIHKHSEREFILKFSAIEIYNESVKDLLSADSTPLRLLDDPEKGTIVEKLTEKTLRDQSHLKELLSFCEAQRQIGETSLNEMSSRSHQILRLTIESSAREFLGKDNLSTLSATVNFIDLAGSERASQALTAGSRLKEGCHINRSLLTLGTVIRKLSKGRSGHIPYRDSKLTRILQHSLGGNARTAIICTMSPARSHIEQTRNTLLFASCAKEVSNNAQVNVVMSDKALVKHLQRELARLENELKYPGLVSHSDVLRQKDSQIKKMEKEMKELMQQRDLAQSRLEDLLRVVGDDQASRQWEEFNQFSIPHESITCEDVFSISETSGVAYQIPEFDFPSFETFNESYNQNGHHLQLPDISNEQYAGSVSSHRSVELFPHQGQDQAKSEDSDHCKEVRCIEVDDSLTSRSDEFSLLLNEESDSLLPSSLDANKQADDEPKSQRTLLPLTLDEDNHEAHVLKRQEALLSPILDVDMHGGHESKSQGTLLPPTVDDDMGKTHETKTKGLLLSPTLDDDKQEDHEPQFKGNTEIKVSSGQEIQSGMKTNISLKQYPDELSPWSSLTELSSSRSLALARSRSCRATLMTRAVSLWFQELEQNINTPSNDGFLKDIPLRHGGIQRRRLSAVNYGADNESLPEEEYKTPEIRTHDNILKEQDSNTFYDQATEKRTNINLLKEQNNRTSSVEGINSLSNFVQNLEEAQIHYQKQLTDGQDMERMVNGGCGVERDMKDIGMEPTQHPSESLLQWPLEFEKKQREIIELWQACHVSLVHRTCFFLLFKGDPADSIYLEVEHRRLSFLRTSSVGNLDKLALGDGSNTTLASSMKNLRREREMLRKQMLKRLSSEERDSLYKKWGVALDSKQRRQQLAKRVWTETNIEHVRESASVVAKLIGLLETGQALKEMFGLNFTPQFTNLKSYSRKHRVSSFM